MTRFDVATLTSAAAALILVPVDDSFADRPPAEQLADAAEFQRYAAAGGLPGVVVPVWRGAAGRAVFLVPRGLRTAVEGLTWEAVVAALNYRVTITRRAVHPRLQPVRDAVVAG